MAGVFHSGPSSTHVSSMQSPWPRQRQGIVRLPPNCRQHSRTSGSGVQSLGAQIVVPLPSSRHRLRSTCNAIAAEAIRRKQPLNRRSMDSSRRGNPPAQSMAQQDVVLPLNRFSLHAEEERSAKAMSALRVRLCARTTRNEQHEDRAANWRPCLQHQLFATVVNERKFLRCLAIKGRKEVRRWSRVKPPTSPSRIPHCHAERSSTAPRT